MIPVKVKRTVTYEETLDLLVSTPGGERDAERHAASFASGDGIDWPFIHSYVVTDRTPVDFHIDSAEVIYHDGRTEHPR